MLFRSEALEDRLTVAIMHETRRRDCELEQFAFASIGIHAQHPLRLFEGQGPEKEIVDQAEDRGVQPDPKGQGQNGNYGKTGGLGQRSKGESKIAEHIYIRVLLFRAESLDRIDHRRPPGR